MIKNILFALMLLNFSSVFGQSISLINPPSSVSGSSDAYINASFDVKNESASNINVKVKRIILSEVTGSENNFCWGTACYPPFVDESPTPEFFTAGAVNTTFKADYNPLENEGESIIQYCFFNNDDPADSVCTIIHFIATSVGINEQEASLSLSNAFPNPTSDFIAIKYKMKNPSHDANLLFYNVVGAEINRVQLVDLQGSVVFPVSKLSPGIYFYSLNSEGENSATKKFVVR
ncbi:MAG: T9SS type A sorting domain-containing protein [Bacteroidetes bacterium]|nr:T9SS type A sorting domain-containing protein [Bacteroidota bacterium]HET6243219.1 T9SS type A sorting domain-containing protein [Bacteroidia bacterium]